MPQELDRIRELSGLQQEAPAANRDDLEKAYMLAVRHHEGPGDDEGTGDGNYSEDVGDLLMDYYEKTGKKPDHEQIERISNKINADEEHYADILNAESINGKIWLELAKKHYGVMMKIKEPITYPESAVAEAPAGGDQALANELSMYFAKLAKEMLQNMQRPNTNDLEYEEFVNIAQAFKEGIQAGLDEVNTSDFEFSSNPFGDFGRSINDGPDEELVKILAKYGYRPGPDGDNDEATIVKQQEESAADINNSTMPTELNRIRELSGLQQEAAAITPNQIEAFKKWYATYSNMQSKDVYNYAKGIFMAHMQTGQTELDGESKQDPRGKAYDDLAKIFPDMDGDIEAIGEKLRSQGVDPTDMEAAEESVLQPEPVLNAVKEAPAAITPNQIEAFKKWYATYSKMQSKDVYNYAQGIFKAHMETGQTDLDGASKQDPRGKAYDDLAKIFPDMDGDIEAIGEKLRSQGVDPLDAEAMAAEEDEDNARLRLKAMAGQESISQVDEAIKKAQAQLKSFSNFDGLKPYKPKKK